MNEIYIFHSSFPVRHKVGNVGIFVLLNFEDILDREIDLFHFNTNHYDKCKFTLKLILISTISNFFH